MLKEILLMDWRKESAYPFTAIEIEPKFKGGEEGFRHLLAKSMHYQKQLKKIIYREKFL
jgi:hypothetical protein